MLRDEGKTENYIQSKWFTLIFHISEIPPMLHPEKERTLVPPDTAVEHWHLRNWKKFIIEKK